MENDKTEKNIFQKLREIRLQKGISLENIAEKSRIQLKYLKAIDSGDILKIPAVYDKLFFRSYLEALDVEQESYFQEFLDIRKSLRLDKTTTVIQMAKTRDSTKDKLLTNRMMFVVLPFALIVVVITFLLLNTEIIGTSNGGKVQEIDIKNVVERINAREQAKLDSLNAVAREDSILNLNINALKRTWFRVITDKNDTSEFLLKRGQNMNVTAKTTFEFLIGRADGLRFTLNDKELELAGSDSTVVRYMLVDSSGIASKILKPTNPENGE